MVNLEVEQVAIEKLTHDPANARIHKKRSVEALKTSLETFGQRKPLVATKEYVVIAGNGTLEAARDLGWSELTVAFIPEEWSNDQIRAYALADNSVALLSSWDEDLLKGSLESLQGSDFDLESLGLPRLMEELPELNELQVFDETAIKVEQGQLWQLGDHRLYCGDATDPQSYVVLMNDLKADCIWTDPPYGVNLEKTTEGIASRNRTSKSTIVNDELSVDDLTIFLNKTFASVINYTQPGSAWYVAGASGLPSQAFTESLAKLNVWRHTLVWVKNAIVMGRADYHYQHEFIYYGWQPGSHKWQGDRKQSTVFNVARPSRSEEHPTMKPIELIAMMLRNSTVEGDLVLDPFGGSGSTLLAAEQLGRKAALIEISTQYCAVIIDRWQRLTEKKAVLLGSQEA